MAKIIKIVTLCLAILVAAYIGLMKFILPSYVATLVPTVEQMATTYINGKVNIGTAQLSSGLTISVGDISVVNNKGEELLQVPSLDVGINLLKGLQGKSPVAAVSSIRIKNPVVHLTMDKQDRWNASGLIKPSEEKGNAFKGKIHITNGHLLVDTPYGRWEAGLQGTVDGADNPDYGLDADVLLENESLNVKGAINTDMQGRMRVRTDSLKLDSFSKLIAHYIPVNALTGSLEKLDLTWESKDKVSMEGEGTLKTVGGRVVSDGRDVALTLDGPVIFNGMEIQTRKLTALVNGQTCVLSGSVDLNDTSEPKAQNLNLEFQKFDLQKAEPSLPADGIISGDLTLDGTKQDYQISGKLRAPVLVAGGMTFTNVVLPLATNKGKLQVENATAGFGGGKIHLVGEYGIEDKEFTAAIDGSQVSLDHFTGGGMGSMQVDGTVMLNGNINSNKFKLSSIGDILRLKWQGNEFRNIALDADFLGDDIVLNNLSASTEQKGIILGRGNIKNDNLDGKVTVVNLPLERFLSLAGQKGKGNLSGDFTLSGSTSAPGAKGVFSLENGEFSGMNIEETHGYAAWENRVLSLKGVEVNMEQGSHILDGTVNMQTNDPVLNLEVTTDNVRIEPLWQYVGTSFPVTGNLTNKLKVAGPLSNLDFSGEVKAWDGSVNKFLVDGVTGAYKFDKGVLYLNNFRVNTLTTTINLEGKVMPDGTLDIGLDTKDIHLARIPILSNYADVEGLADFNGAIAGTYKTPLFNGALTSNNIEINGEGFTGIACYLHSQGGTINKLNGTFQQTAGGDYAVDLLADFGQRFLQGSIDVQKGNVKSLLNIAKEDLDIKGFLTGRIEINKAGPHTGMTVIGHVDDGQVRGIDFKAAEFDLYANRGYWRINNLKAEEKDGGVLLAKGEVNARKDKRTIDMEIGTNAASAKLLTVAMTDPIDLEGKMDVAAQLKGSLDNPEGNFSLQVSPGSISGVGFDNLYGLATLRNDMFKLEQVLIQKGEYKISAYGDFPQDLLRSENKRRNPAAKMDLYLNMDNANLAILPSISPVVESAAGNIKGGITITGTLEDYNLNGNIKLAAGTVKFKRVKTTLDNIAVDVAFAGKSVNLKEMTATTGKKGKLDAHGTLVLAGETKMPYLLDYSAKDVDIESSIFKGTINAEGNVEQKNNRPQVNSHIRLDDVLLNITTIPELGEGKSNLGLNVTLELGPKIHMHNPYFYNLWLAGGLHATGSTRYPHVEGNIYATKGTISYMSTPFNIKHAELTWPQRGFVPHVNFEANTRFRNYNIKVKANGPLTMDTLSANLSSDPARTPNEIVRMLTLKTDTVSSNDDMQSLLDAGLQMAFLSDVEDFVKRSLTLDEFRVYSGNTRSGLGFDLDSLKANSATGEEKKQYNLLVSKNIAKNLMIGYTSSLDQEYHSVFAEYNLGKHFSLNFSKNEKDERWYGIQYQTSF